MMSREIVIGLRALVVWLTVSGMAVLVAAALSPSVRVAAPVGTADFESLLTATCSAALLLVTGWCWLVTTSELLGVACRTRPRLRAPLPLRRLVAVACGVGVLATAAPAHAAPADPGPGPASGRSIVVGLPLPTRPLGVPPPRAALDVAPRPVLAPKVAPSPVVERPASVSGGPTVTVRAGDSLWAIAERLLPDDADAADIDSAWRALWHGNRSAIGDDPDLIQPDTALRLTDPKEPR